MAAQEPAPIAMPQMPQYKPDTFQPDDPDTYMKLAFVNINTKLPISQIGCVILGILFAIISLSIDEMSDGDIKFSNGNPEIDYDCGWRQFRLNVGGYSERYDYDGQYCSNNDEVIDEEFCENSAIIGKAWLAFSLIGIFALIGSIVAILNKKFGGKDSWIYFALLLVGCGGFSTSTIWWWMGDRCEDVENYNDFYLEADFRTDPGPSLYLMFCAVLSTLAALLITMLHICNRIRREYYPQRQHPNYQQSFISVQQL